MGDLTIKLPVGDPDQLLDAKAVGELPLYLTDDEDRAVTRQLLSELLIAKPEGMPLTIGLVDESLGAMSKDVLRRGLDKLRRAAGLEGVDHLKHQRFQATYVPDRRPAETVVLPSGALALSTDLEDEDARQRAWARSAAAQRKAREADQAADIAARREYEHARAERLRSELPPGVPG